MDKVIWTYWHQGWDQAPEISQRCLSSWLAHNVDWEIRALCKTSLSAYLDLEKELPDFSSKQIDYAARSDLIRVLLLKKYGGIWVDSTVLCTTPLDTWIYPYLEQDFFAFDRPGEDRMVSSWFLAASSTSHIVKCWYEKTLEYWQGRDACDEYFWFHFLFNEAYDSNSLFREIWDRTPKIPAQLPHLFAPYEKIFFEKNTEKIVESLQNPEAPVFKLTHKYDHDKNRENTVLDYILSGGQEAAY